MITIVPKFLRRVLRFFLGSNSMKMLQEEVVYLTNTLAALGISIGDVFYWPNKKDEMVYVVVVGYQPEKACLFTVQVDYNLDTAETTRIEFAISGQANESVYDTFHNIPHIAARGESFYDMGLFSTSTIVKTLFEGVKFYSKCIQALKGKLQPQFLVPINLNYYAPEHSDEFSALAHKYGNYAQEIYSHFGNLALKKLPSRIFAPEQFLV